MLIFTPKNKKNLSNLAIFYVFRDSISRSYQQHPTRTMKMTKTPCHTKIIQKSKEKLKCQFEFPKNNQYCSKIPILRRAKHPPTFRSNQPNFAQKSVKSVDFLLFSLKNPQKVSIFNQYRSKNHQILPKFVLYTSKLAIFTSQCHDLRTKIEKPRIL